MNTETGRIYDVGTLYSTREERRARDRRLSSDQERFEREAAQLDEERRAFETEHRAGKVVPVSDQVAQQVRLGQRELERRTRRRKAAKQARKRNR